MPGPVACCIDLRFQFGYACIRHSSTFLCVEGIGNGSRFDKLLFVYITLISRAIVRDAVNLMAFETKQLITNESLMTVLNLK